MVRFWLANSVHVIADQNPMNRKSNLKYVSNVINARLLKKYSPFQLSRNMYSTMDSVRYRNVDVICIFSNYNNCIFLFRFSSRYEIPKI